MQKAVFLATAPWAILLFPACGSVRPRLDATPVEIENAYMAAARVAGGKDFGAAARALRRFLQEFPSSLFEEKARFDLAAALEKGGDFMGAHDAYLDLQRKFPGTPAALQALKMDLELGVSRLAHEERFLGLRLGGHNAEGVEILQDVMKQDRTGACGLEARMALGEYYLAVGEFESALAEFEGVAENFPETEQAVEAKQKRAVVLAQMAGPGGRGGDRREEAKEAVTKLAEEGGLSPGDEKTLDDLIRRTAAEEAREALETARFYLLRGRPASARIYLEFVATKFPGTPEAREAEGMAGRLGNGQP